MIDDEIIRAQIGAHVCKWRQRRGMSRTELADAIGSSERGVMRFEVGMVEMPTALIVRAAWAMRIDARELMPDLGEIERAVRL